MQVLTTRGVKAGPVARRAARMRRTTQRRGERCGSVSNAPCTSALVSSLMHAADDVEEQRADLAQAAAGFGGHGRRDR